MARRDNNRGAPLSVGSTIRSSVGYGAGTGGVSLTGQAAVAGAGTLTPVMEVVLTGLGTTASQGSTGPVFGLPLAGQSVAAAQGSVTPASAAPLSGQAVVSAIGTLLPQIGVPLTGQSVVAAQGSTGPVISVALTGQATAIAQGATLPQTSIALLGQGVSIGQGVMVAPGDITVALTGVAATVGLGITTPVITPDTQPGKSHTDLTVRQMLIDYYTVAFAKKTGLVEELGKSVKTKTRKKATASATSVLPVPKKSIAEKILEAAATAELTVTPDLAPVVSELVASALKFNALVLDFQSFAKEQQALRRRREDDELLLIASIL